MRFVSSYCSCTRIDLRRKQQFTSSANMKRDEPPTFGLSSFVWRTRPEQVSRRSSSRAGPRRREGTQSTPESRALHRYRLCSPQFLTALTTDESRDTNLTDCDSTLSRPAIASSYWITRIGTQDTAPPRPSLLYHRARSSWHASERCCARSDDAHVALAAAEQAHRAWWISVDLGRCCRST